jgi:DNA (cytosine-5)-methyltransferase 1
MGWQPLAFSEIEPFPSAILAHHWPHVPNLGDMTKWREWPEELLTQIDVLVGGTPCQAFSVAGLRNSMSDERGNLTLIYAHLLDHIDTLRAARGLPPVICLWENVPGVLSTKDNAFGCFLGALAGEESALEPSGTKWSNAGWVLGPQRAIAWRTLDAQYFGVAQRRRRVFLVASARNDFSPEAVLFEFQGVRRDSPPSREARQGTPTVPAHGTGSGGLGTYWDGGEVSQTLDAVLAKGQTMPEKNRFPAVLVPEVYPTLDASFNRKWGSNQWVNNGFAILDPVAFAQNTRDEVRLQNGDGSISGALAAEPGMKQTTYVAFAIQAGAIKENPNHGPDGVGVRTDDQAYTIEARAEVQAVAFQSSQSGVRVGEVHATLDSNNRSRRHNGTVQAMQVRRLTPTECERLQGFPDGHTLISWKKKPTDDCPDGPRYKALGNSMAVPCMAWIGRRIQSNLPTP